MNASVNTHTKMIPTMENAANYLTNLPDLEVSLININIFAKEGFP